MVAQICEQFFKPLPKQQMLGSSKVKEHETKILYLLKMAENAQIG